MRHPRLTGLAVATATTVLALGAAELALRAGAGEPLDAGQLRRRLEASRAAPLEEAGGRFSLYGLVQASADPEVVYELKPGLAGSFQGRPVRINRLGLRGPEVTAAKPARTLRVVGLGDSVMFGWGVGEGETYLEHLDDLLAAALATPIETLNCAVPGYNTTMEVALLAHRCRDLAPDLVLLHVVANDLGLPHFMQPPRGAAPSRWRLVELARAALGRDQPVPELLRHDRSGLPPAVREGSRARYEPMRGEPGLRRAVDRLAALAADTPVVITTEGLDGWRGRLLPALAREHGWHLVDLAPALAAWLDEEGLPPTRGAWRRSFQIPRDGHPNALAHRLYAETLAVELAPVMGGRPAAAPR